MNATQQIIVRLYPEGGRERELRLVPAPRTIAPEDGDWTVTLPADPPPEDRPRLLGGRAAIAKRVNYPEAARREGVEGVVIVKALVGRDGKVEDVEIVKSLGYGCDEAAMDAVRRVQFRPAYQCGVAVRFWFSTPVNFILMKN